ncbi:hypothetical protein AMJ49_00050 [Parcubacteria bacterium DG_74_2]|nr:MAG: hypothetical protein AMJ49_00050 [Parcubacteria bacterium DG_74_2]
MNFKKIFGEINIVSQCKKYHLPIWQCPHFIFLIMGFLIFISSLFAYILGNRYIQDPLLVALLTIFLTGVFFVFGFILVRGFENLAEANRLKSEFVSIVSHQLRSPLSNLRWVLELIMSGKIEPVSQKQLEYFKILKENSDRMGELIKDLLIISRIETARLPIRNENFSLGDLVNSLITDFKPLAEASNVKIELKEEKNLPKTFGDPSKIKLVVENLLDNAIRYIKGKGEVKINLKHQKNKIYFEIEDNGVGIPKEDQKYIFQKFFRSENILKYQTQGTGLGLHISKYIVEKSGGKIGFKSQEGKGSTFWFTVPIK